VTLIFEMFEYDDYDQVDRFEGGEESSLVTNSHYKIAGLELLRNHYPPKMYEPHLGPYGDRSATTS